MPHYRVERKKGNEVAVLSIDGHELSKGKDLDGLIKKAMRLVEKAGADGEVTVFVNRRRTRHLKRGRFILDWGCPPEETPFTWQVLDFESGVGWRRLTEDPAG